MTHQVKIDVSNPKENILGGVKYLKQLIDECNGDVVLGLAAYNAGMGRVRKYKGVPPFKETRSYIRKVYKYKEVYDFLMSEKI